MDAVKNMFSARGRIRRSEWWLMGIGLAVARAILTLVATAFVAGPGGLADPAQPIASVIAFVFAALFFWPILAVSIKRAHDRNGSGIVVILFTIIDLLMNALTAAEAEGFISLVPYELPFGLLSLVMIGVGLFLFVTLGFLEGTRGKNRYGPSPKFSPDYQAPKNHD